MNAHPFKALTTALLTMGGLITFAFFLSIKHSLGLDLPTSGSLFGAIALPGLALVACLGAIGVLPAIVVKIFASSGPVSRSEMLRLLLCGLPPLLLFACVLVPTPAWWPEPLRELSPNQTFAFGVFAAVPLCCVLGGMPKTIRLAPSTPDSRLTAWVSTLWYLCMRLIRMVVDINVIWTLSALRPKSAVEDIQARLVVTSDGCEQLNAAVIGGPVCLVRPGYKYAAVCPATLVSRLGAMSLIELAPLDERGRWPAEGGSRPYRYLRLTCLLGLEAIWCRPKSHVTKSRGRVSWA